MRTVRMFTISFTFVLICVASLLATGGSAHAATRQTRSSTSATSSSSCAQAPQTFSLSASSTITHGLVLVRASDGTSILLVAAADSSELNFGMATLYVWFKFPGQNTWQFYEDITIYRLYPAQVSDVGVQMTVYGQPTPEAIFNYCEWTAHPF